MKGKNSLSEIFHKLLQNFKINSKDNFVSKTVGIYRVNYFSENNIGTILDMLKYLGDY